MEYPWYLLMYVQSLLIIYFCKYQLRSISLYSQWAIEFENNLLQKKIFWVVSVTTLTTLKKLKFTENLGLVFGAKTYILP